MVVSVIRKVLSGWLGGGVGDTTLSLQNALGNPVSSLSWAPEPFLDLVEIHAVAVVASARYDHVFGRIDDPVDAEVSSEWVASARPPQRIALTLGHSAKEVLANLVSHARKCTRTDAKRQAAIEAAAPSRGPANAAAEGVSVTKPLLGLALCAIAASAALPAGASQTLTTEAVMSGSSPVRIDSCRAVLVDKPGPGGVIPSIILTKRTSTSLRPSISPTSARSRSTASASSLTFKTRSVRSRKASGWIGLVRSRPAFRFTRGARLQELLEPRFRKTQPEPSQM
ncbi:MAG TPA: hypothetical protein VMT95_01160 [Candidatus Binatia bacterium]|nr:hypothetical protein [Candidatus Binatia bacterium]